MYLPDVIASLLQTLLLFILCYAPTVMIRLAVRYALRAWRAVA